MDPRAMVGYRFRPTEEEMVSYFLHRYVTGQPTPGYEGKMVNCCLYGKNATPWEVLGEDEPWDDWDESGNKKGIFVISEKMVEQAKNGQPKLRASRRAGCGTWDGKAVAQDVISVKNSPGQVIGQKRSFTFKPDKKFEKEMSGRGNWIMHELSLQNNNSNYVICRITKDLSKEKNKKRASDDDEGYKINGKRKFQMVSDDEMGGQAKKNKGEKMVDVEESAVSLVVSSNVDVVESYCYDQAQDQFVPPAYNNNNNYYSDLGMSSHDQNQQLIPDFDYYQKQEAVVPVPNCYATMATSQNIPMAAITYGDDQNREGASRVSCENPCGSCDQNQEVVVSQDDQITDEGLVPYRPIILLEELSPADHNTSMMITSTQQEEGGEGYPRAQECCGLLAPDDVIDDSLFSMIKVFEEEEVLSGVLSF